MPPRRLAAPGSPPAGIALHAGAVPHQGEGTADGAGIALVALDPGLGDFLRLALFRGNNRRGFRPGLFRRFTGGRGAAPRRTARDGGFRGPPGPRAARRNTAYR
jgi:hypothetical protein